MFSCLFTFRFRP